MIEVTHVLAIHQILIEQFGGTLGVRNLENLESAVNRPYSTFDGADLYPTTIDKAAALIESIIKNHPFVDGNKRTGYTIMRLHLIRNGVDLIASEEEKYMFVIAIAEGRLSIDEITTWIKVNSKSVEVK